MKTALMRPDDGNLLERDGIHAIAQSAGFRAVGEDVAKMGVAGVADRFNARGPVAAVQMISDSITGYRLSERRPTSAGIEFFRSAKQDGIATQAGIDSRLEEIAHGRTEGSLGAGLAGDLILFGAELLAPFGVTLRYFVIGRWVALFSEAENIVPFEHDRSHIMARRPRRKTKQFPTEFRVG